MRVSFFSAHAFDRTFFDAANQERHQFRYIESRLNPDTAALALGSAGVCAFVNDDLGARTLEVLAAGGTRMIALRSAGFNHVDLPRATQLGLTVARVPAYSPHAVAEHTLALILTLNRGIHRAHARVRDGNFALDGLLGFDLYGRTVGVVGTGRIGAVVCRILSGFGCRVLAHDPAPNEACRAMGVEYVDLATLLGRAEIVTLHAPLTPHTRHLIDADAVARMRRGVMLINTSRGALVDTRAVIAALKTGQIGHLGLDVYEEEEGLFFEDRSSVVLQDDVFARLLTFPNVIVTSHQGFFTREAMTAIAETTVANMSAFEAGTRCGNELA